MSPVLSVLDLAPVTEGSTPADALRRSTELIRHVERLGYHRHWVAEHHNMPGIASSSPPVLIAHLAASTSTIRVGAGGVMLPNHASLVVAEQFGMLEALHPGRIDLGIGRAPGTDMVTAAALRRSTNPADIEDSFPTQLRELLDYFQGANPRITAVPAQGYQPALWMLGSSDYSAQVAGYLGVPFCHAHHFSANGTDAAVAAYRAAFRPSEVLDTPYVALGVPVICAPTNDEATFLSGSSMLNYVRFRQGQRTLLPSPEDAAARTFTPMEKELTRGWRAPLIMGDPSEVRDGLEALATRTGADELLLTTSIHGHAERMRSYELVAEAFSMASPAAVISLVG